MNTGVISIVNLCGPSGSGKTTIIAAAAESSHPATLPCKIHTMQSRASALVRIMGLDLTAGYGSIQSMEAIERLHYGIVIQHYEGLINLIDRASQSTVIVTDRGPVDFVVNYDMHIAALTGRNRPSAAQAAASRNALLRLIDEYRKHLVGVSGGRALFTHTWLVPPLQSKTDANNASRGRDKIDASVSADQHYLKQAVNAYVTIYGVDRLPAYAVSPIVPDDDRIQTALTKIHSMAACPV